jgi:hypothetical protein
MEHYFWEHISEWELLSDKKTTLQEALNTLPTASPEVFGVIMGF